MDFSNEQNYWTYCTLIWLAIPKFHLQSSLPFLAWTVYSNAVAISATNDATLGLSGCRVIKGTNLLGLG